jgi:hypothetical protein
MNRVSPFIHNIKEKFSNAFSISAQQVNLWKAQGGRLIRSIPQQMQQHPYVAIATINTVFFVTMHPFINYLDRQVEKLTLNPTLRKIKPIFLDGLVFGGLAFAVNKGLSKIMQYPLSQFALVTITAALIATRVLFKWLEKSSGNQEEVKPIGEEFVTETKTKTEIEILRERQLITKAVRAKETVTEILQKILRERQLVTEAVRAKETEIEYSNNLSSNFSNKETVIEANNNTDDSLTDGISNFFGSIAPISFKNIIKLW